MAHKPLRLIRLRVNRERAEAPGMSLHVILERIRDDGTAFPWLRRCFNSVEYCDDQGLTAILSGDPATVADTLVADGWPLD